jgi:hypothetical protein
MNRRFVVIFFCFLLSLGLVIILPFHSARTAGPWYVAPDGDDGDTCADASHPCATINGALNKPGFMSGDMILVAAGVYTGTDSQVVSLDKGAVLSGGWEASFSAQSGTSTIDAEGARRGLDVPYGITATVEHFTVVNANDHGIVNIGNLTVSRTTISGNTETVGHGGGGIYNLGTMNIYTSTISGNTAYFGGGISNEGTVYIYNSVIRENESTGDPGNNYGGGGIYSDYGTVILESSRITGNTAHTRGGGAIHSSYSAVVLTDCILSGNIGGTAGGIAKGGGSLRIENSTLSDNTAFGRGGGISIAGSGEVAIINNSTLSGNTAGSMGGAIYAYAHISINSSTITENQAEEGGGVYRFTYGSSVTLQNTILAGNDAPSGPDCLGTIDSSGYNLVWDTKDCTFTPGTGDLTGVDANLGELIGAAGHPRYHPLFSGSPAIDAGNPAGCTDDQGAPLDSDQRGASRVNECDIGAYEYTTPGPADSVHDHEGTDQRTAPSTPFSKPLEVVVLDQIGSPVSTATVIFTAPLGGPSGIFTDTGSYTTTATTNNSGVSASVILVANELEGSYVVTGTVSGLPSPAYFMLGNYAWYVAPSGVDTNDCHTPSSPCASINGALAKPGFMPGDTVKVSVGIYTGSGDEVVSIDKDVILSGGWDEGFSAQNSASILDGEMARGVISVGQYRTAVLERFVVQHGFPDWGIYNDHGDLTVINSTIRNNSGRGIYSYIADLTLVGSTVRDNSAISGGGGISSYGGTLTIVNSTISGNSNVGEGGGGGIHNSGDLTIKSSTITDNHADIGGGINVQYGSATFQNNILAGNVAKNGPDCSGTLVSGGHNLIGDLSGCDFTSGSGDLTVIDALLGELIGVTDSPWYHPLLAGSPAIDAGSPSGCTDQSGLPLDIDQRGASRVGECDMGAYEYVDPGAADSIHAVGGTPQRAVPSQAFGEPLQAVVLDTIGSPVSVRTVYFTAPSSGASGTFMDTATYTTTAQTNASGVATAVTFTTNASTGSYLVTATTSGVVNPTNFALDNLVWYVTPGGSDSNDCISPTNACATINEVLSKPDFMWGDTVRVSAGFYSGDGDEVVLIDTDVILSGGWDADFTHNNGRSTIDGVESRRGMNVLDFRTVHMEHFGIQSGSADYGGGLRNQGVLTLYDVVISANNTVGDGGGIYNNGILTLDNCNVNGNTASTAGGIYNSGTMTLYESTVDENTGSGTGGGIYNYHGPLHLIGSTVSGNTTEGGGGGIRNGSTMTLTNSFVSGNMAGGYGDGSGIYNEWEKTLILNSSSVIDNKGNGIYNSSGFVTLNNSTVSDNSGTGIDTYGGTVDLNNCTISGNTTTGSGGGIYNSSPLTVNNCTISGNSADSYGGGIFTDFDVTMRNSILADNTTSALGPNCYGTINSQGYNLIDDTSDCDFVTHTGDLLGVEPKLFALTGSPGFHPLLRGSPAIDAGDPGGCRDHQGNILDTDQRGVARVGRCDIGSYEFDPFNDAIFYMSLPLVVYNYCPDFYDDFSDPASGWGVVDDELVRAEYLDGEFRVLTKNDDYMYLFRAPTCDQSNYVVEVDARWVGTPGSSYGLVFGISGSFNQYYIFDVNTDYQDYRLLRFDGSGYYTIVPITSSAAINSGTGTNHLKATRNGDSITLEVNGTVLGTWTDGNITGLTGVGILSAPYEGASTSDSRFDNFSVSGLPPTGTVTLVEREYCDPTQGTYELIAYHNVTPTLRYR